MDSDLGPAQHALSIAVAGAGPAHAHAVGGAWQPIEEGGGQLRAAETVDALHGCRAGHVDADPGCERLTLDTHTEAAVSEDGGETWGEPVRAVERFIPNMPPAAVASGRLIMSGNLRYPYTDDTEGVSRWRDAVLPRLPGGYVDDPEGFHKGCRQRGDPHGYCEGSFFQTDDGVIHMMLRIADREPRRRRHLVGAGRHRLHRRLQPLPVRASARRPFLRPVVSATAESPHADDPRHQR